MLGASGSGKSSLVRAGLVLRLKRDHDFWLVVDPFRPRGRPFTELSKVVASCYQRIGQRRDWQGICDGFCRESKSMSDGLSLVDLIDDLLAVAGVPEATVLQDVPCGAVRRPAYTRFRRTRQVAPRHGCPTSNGSQAIRLRAALAADQERPQDLWWPFAAALAARRTLLRLPQRPRA